MEIFFDVPTIHCPVTNLAKIAATSFELLCEECSLRVILVFHILHDLFVLAFEGLFDGLDIEGLGTIAFFKAFDRVVVSFRQIA